MVGASHANAVAGRRRGVAGAPAGRRKKCGADAPLPGRGAEFTEDEVCERFGVEKRGGVRVNHESRIIVLVDGTDAAARGGNAGRGEHLEFSGGVGAQGAMSPDDTALANSRAEGYDVLYFAKKRGRLRFEGLVECTSHAPPDGARRGQKTSFRLGPIGDELDGWTPPRDSGPGRTGTAEGMPPLARKLEARRGPARLFPRKVTPESLDKILGSLARSGRARADDETMQRPFAVRQAGAKDAEDLESCIETLDILADPDLVEEIRESEADLRAGRVVPWVKGRAQNTR